MSLKVPKYKDLPIKKDAPPGSAWGVFDKANSPRDILGTLNFITKEAVVAAKAEIVTGESCVLNLPFHLPHNANPGRIKLEHKLLNNVHNMCICDDEISMNTQSSSQWDGLMHFANQERKEYYNGVSYAKAAEEKSDSSLGIQGLSPPSSLFRFKLFGY
jgi:hypothetical protein